MKLLSTVLAIVAALSFSHSANAIQASVISRPSAQVECLAQNAYFEARNQPLSGKIAVMNVVMNRTLDSRFPKTPCGVIHQRTGRSCQFSWVCTPSTIRDHSSYNELKDLAAKVYNGQVGDVTGGAKFFHNRAVKPGWRHTVTKVIQSHVFYR